MTITYPQIDVQLVGTDGNAYALIGKVARALKDDGVTLELRDLFTQQAFESKSYDELLNFLAETVNVL